MTYLEAPVAEFNASVDPGAIPPDELGEGMIVRSPWVDEVSIPGSGAPTVKVVDGSARGEVTWPVPFGVGLGLESSVSNAIQYVVSQLNSKMSRTSESSSHPTPLLRC